MFCFRFELYLNSIFLAGFFLLASTLLQPAGTVFAQTNDEGGWQTIDTHSLDDWSDPGGWWKAEDGVIFAESKADKTAPNVHFLMWNGSLKGDFEIVFDYRILATEPQDAGFYFRTDRPNEADLKQLSIKNRNLLGLQAELDTAILYSKKKFIRNGKLFGHIHDGKRGRMYQRGNQITIIPGGEQKKTPLPNKFIVRKAFKRPPAWNRVQVIVQGDRSRLYLNDVLANDITDNDTQGRSNGDAIALQFRPSKGFRYEVKGMKYRNLD